MREGMETMRIVRLLISSLALMAVFLTGCEGTPRVQHMYKPTARMMSLRLQEVKLGQAMLVFEIEIDNPYPGSLSLVSLSYSLTSGAGTFITTTPIYQATVLPNRRQIVALPDEVIYARLLKALNSKPGSTVPYRARLWLQVDIPSSGLVELALIYEGQLVLPNGRETNRVDNTSPRFAARKPLELGLSELSCTVWPLRADIWYASRLVV